MRLSLTFAWCATVLAASSVCSQSFPSRPVRIVVGGIGGSLDVTARLIAQGMAAPLGQPVLVENRPSVITAATSVSGAQADGHTLLMTGPNLWLLPLLESKTPFDPFRDFLPVTMVLRSPSIMVVTPTLPVKSVKDLISLARARPGEINYASGATGSMAHLVGELFSARAGVRMTRINYSSATAGLIDLASGQVQVMFPVAASTAPYLKSGRLRALAVTSREPSRLAPGVPTMAAAGLPGYESVAVNGVFAPAGATDAVITRLNQEILRVLDRQEIKDTFLNMGVESAGSSPAGFTAFIKSDIATMGKVIKDANIRAE